MLIVVVSASKVCTNFRGHGPLKLLKAGVAADMNGAEKVLLSDFTATL